MSAPQNPISESTPVTGPEFCPPQPGPTPVPPIENPPWNFWDVLALVFITFFSGIACIFVTAYVAHARFSRGSPWADSLKSPVVIVAGQLLAYLLVLMLMYGLVRNRSHGRVLESVRWNWPANWNVYLIAGIVLAIVLVPLGNVLPMPKEAPIDQFFRTAQDAYVLSLFGVLFAPLFEEVFFRGLLYPVVARWLGLYPAIVITAILFALIHGSQLNYSWGPVVIIFLVGIALTTVRAVKKSLSASILMHMAYNGTIFVTTYIATDGFRHMEKFSQ